MDRQNFGSYIRKNEDVIYNYGWWIYPKQNALAAIGKNGQLAYIVPAKDMIIIRLGKDMAGIVESQ